MKRKKRPWWLSAAEEVCAACGHRYPHGVGARCVDCDKDLCPVCVAFRENEAFCADCPPRATRRRR